MRSFADAYRNGVEALCAWLALDIADTLFQSNQPFVETAN